MKQFASLYQLRDGWLDGEGKALNHDDLDWLVGKASEHGMDRLSIPFYCYPMLNGGVEIDWECGLYSISLEINLDNRQGVYDCYHTKTLDLKNDKSWQWIKNELEGIAR